VRKRRRKRKRRTNLTAHRRAMADPKVKRLLTELRTTWNQIDGIHRGDCLRALISLGCSTRGLGKELEESPTSIGRHMELSRLPEIDREAVAGGASAKKVLTAKAGAAKVRRQQERVLIDRNTGILSDELADVILEFCRAGVKPTRRPIQRAQLDLFLERVTEQVERSTARPIRVSKKLGVAGLFKLARPRQNSEEVLWFEYQAKWLASIVRFKVSEHEIVERSFNKVVQRASELETDKGKTPTQSFSETMLRRIALGASPTRRPEYQTRLPRQGQNSDSSPILTKRKRKE
jgi:hypothetical protein